MKTAKEVTDRIFIQVGIRLKSSKDKVFKKGGREYILIDENIGMLFNQTAHQIERLPFIDRVDSAGANQSVIYLKKQ